ncbi:sensor histidine kinase [Parapedobacter soli]|uniref:sensor histidine kinase n=1 Tax=Parapedobacter soli TaxID=416955 RepID=UPI0021C5DB3D|nr:HAMP domain-containing histidine kinase [Parapedobacter soli]
MSTQYRQFRPWATLKGSPDEFSLQGRIFHSVCAFAMMGLLVSVPINYVFQQYEALYLLFVAIVLLIIYFVLSRVAKRVELAIGLFGVTINVFFSLIFLFAGGINGPNLLSFWIALFPMIVLSSSKRAKLIWCAINISLLTTLLYVQYRYPDWVSFEYNTLSDRLWDHLFQYIILSSVLYYGTSYIITNYEFERRSAADRAEAIRGQHLEIGMQKEELERLNTEKDRMFSIIAHDLRTPLGNIHNYMDMLFHTALEPDKRQYIEGELKKQLAGTSALLTNLLTWAQQQIKGITVKSEPVNLRTCIRDALEIELGTARAKGVELTLPDEDVVAHTDRHMIQIIIRNLVNNALKFTEPNGRVRVSAIATAGAVAISVADNGIGIPEEAQDRIFTLNTDPNAGTRNERGVGLGLVLCKELSEALGGTLRFVSTPGKGTTFILELR